VTDALAPEAAARAARREEIERELVRLSSRDVVAEHAAMPFGRHSPALALVLSYFAQSPTRGKRALLDAKRTGFKLVTLSGDQLVAHEISEERYSSEAEAAHAVFLRRLHGIGQSAGPPTP
jgi:hypothetical protein